MKKFKAEFIILAGLSLLQVIPGCSGTGLIFDPDSQLLIVTHSRTTSEKGNPDEAVTLGVQLMPSLGSPEKVQYLWAAERGTFDDPTGVNPVWFPPDEVIDLDITVTVSNGRLTLEGSTHQWVTQWPLITRNPHSPDGDIISHELDAVFYDGLVDPADFAYPALESGSNVVYMNFWYSWCYPCIRELPQLTDLYQNYQDQDFVHFQINVADSREAVGDFVTRKGYSADYWLLDPDFDYYYLNDAWLLEYPGVPMHLVFDRDGKCRGGHVGEISGVEDITKYLDELL